MADIGYKRRFGDRKEGRLLRSISIYQRIMPYIMAKKNDACNQFSDSLELTELDRWFLEKRQEGWKGMGMLHLFVAAYVRTVASCPSINRFVSGQKIYARNNIEVVMTVKKNLTADAEEGSIKAVFEPTDTVFDVYRKMNEKVDEIKADDDKNATDRLAAVLMKLPGLLLRFAIGFLNFLDYFGWLPQSLLDASPFHGSMIVTDLGSIGIPPIYHHLYNFGNLPVFIAFGAKRRVVELNKTGLPVERKYVDYRLTLDERIADGLTYATALKYMKYYIKNPALLELPPEKVESDVL